MLHIKHLDKIFAILGWSTRLDSRGGNSVHPRKSHSISKSKAWDEAVETAMKGTDQYAVMVAVSERPRSTDQHCNNMKEERSHEPSPRKTYWSSNKYFKEWTQFLLGFCTAKVTLLLWFQTIIGRGKNFLISEEREARGINGGVSHD